MDNPQPSQTSPEEPTGEHGAPEKPESLFDRFPALKRLVFHRSARRMPVVEQMTATDCGAACLAMVMALHGKEVRLDEIRQVSVSGRDGVDALSILNTARWFGMRGRGVRIEVEDLEYLDEGSILHWEFNHFVVFERLTKRGVDIIDPAFGRRRIPMEQFRRSFTGVALLFEPGDNFVPSKGEKKKQAWRYVRQILSYRSHWKRILVTSVLLQVFALALPVLTGSVVDRVVPRGDYHLLTVLSIGFFSLVLFNFLASLIRSNLLLHLRTYLDARMTLGFLDHLVDLPYAFFQRRAAGDLMMRLNSNATIREILTSGALSGLLDGTLVFVYLILLFVASPPLGFIVFGLGFLDVSVFLLSRKRQKELMSESLHVQAKSQSYEVEMFNGIETLKATGSEHRAVEHWTDLFVDNLNVSLDRGRLSATVDSVMSTLRMASPLLLLVYGALKVLDGEMTLGTMLALNALATGFLGPLSSLVSTALQLQLLGSYIERIDDVFETEPEQDRTKVQVAPKLSGRIMLDKVSFRYGPTTPLVVQEVSLRIEPGQFVAIVGRSGSGKSTLASLLLGLYKPTSGRIMYDGIDLADLEIRSVREQLGIVVQRPYLFGTSIRANIALSDPTIPLDRVVEACRLAQIHDEVTEMPMGVETLLLDGGASLSGGQRQRVALARALVRRPAILLLDEATSALDAVTEAKVQVELSRLKCTRIVIAHRLSTIVSADLILMMEDGRVVEQGTHAELLKRNGKYGQLVAAQVAGRVVEMDPRQD
ncbi:MAG: peptidase domain-containing ABC transporter [Deltaproteobacteria bacterium]|nr:peptidase domain-containing ABC transporter [Deltaproteobacteria bacterium]